MARFLPLRPVTFDASRRQAARRSLYSSSSREEEEELRSIFGREEEVRVSSFGREGFLGSGAGFDSVFFLDGVEVLGSGAFLGGAAALGVGGVLGRELDFFSDLDDFSALSDFDFSDFSVFEDFSGFDAEGVLDFECAVFDAVAVLEDDDFEGVGGVVLAGGDVLVLNESKGLGHAPMALGVSSTAGASFFDLASALVLAGVLDSGVALFAAAALSAAPLLPVATGGGAVSGTAVSPNSCRARSFTLGNMVCETLGWCDSGRLYRCKNTKC
jgi:hypothetical protein